MITLELNNSYSRLLGLTPSLDKSLREHLSYSIDAKAAYFSGNYGPRRKTLVDKYGFWPTGLLTTVRRWLVINKLEYTVADHRIQPKKSSVQIIKPGVTPYPDQLEAVESALRHHRGTISMPTGSGKSLVIALIASRFNLNTLVVVPSVEIKRQLRESLSSVMDDVSRVTIENIDSKKLKTLKHIDCMIIDECHHVAAKTYQKLNKTAWKDIYYRFMLTATPFRNQTEEQLLYEGIAGEVIFKLSYADAVKKGYVVPVEAYYLEVPQLSPKGYTYAEIYKELIVENSARNDMISVLLLRLNSQRVPTLCLVREVAHGEALMSATGLPFANGKDEETREYIRDFNNGIYKALIGTNGILGEGVDTKPCEYVIIAGLGKAKSAFQQQVGRAVRRYPGKESAKVIILKDTSHKFTLRHYKEQAKILKEEYGLTPIKLEL